MPLKEQRTKNQLALETSITLVATDYDADSVGRPRRAQSICIDTWGERFGNAEIGRDPLLSVAGQ